MNYAPTIFNINLNEIILNRIINRRYLSDVNVGILLEL